MKTLGILFVAFFGFVGIARAADLPGDSIFQIDSKWVDQDGKEFELSHLRGKPTILSMVYLSCRYICPAVISEVQALESELNKKSKMEVQIVLVSFDPERDTVPVLKKYAVDRKLDLNRWKLMTNKNESKIRELAIAMDFKYQKDEKGDFTHSYMILALDADGVIKSRLDGANLDHKQMIDTIKSMIAVKK